ncbi:MAG: aminopeptidase P N-terminal domain-containing protein [Longimicrobiales bacterium]
MQSSRRRRRHAHLAACLALAGCASGGSEGGPGLEGVPLPPGAPVAIAIAAVDPLEPFPSEEFEARRERLMAALDTGVAVLLGETAPTSHARFLQDHNFYYLTGIEAPGAALVLDATRGVTHLFLPERSEEQEQWEGDLLEPGQQAGEVTGIEDVRPRAEFDAFLRDRLGQAELVWLQHSPPEPPPTSPGDAGAAWAAAAADPWLDAVHRNARLVELVAERFPDVTIRDLSPPLFRARWVKSGLEQEYMRRAGLLAALGANEAIRTTRPGYFEFELAAAARFVQDVMGQQEEAFAPILASGPNINTIHYTELDRRLRADDLVMLDYGADYGYYTSDITRTWAADGQFTDEQAPYYETVVMVRDSVIEAMRPGVTVDELLDIAQRVVRARGHDAVAWPTTREYIGHWVGMSVHDPAPEGAHLIPLEAGVVFNVEPIIDMPDRAWHFRLEDTVLITEDGHEVLTRMSPVAQEDLVRLYLETGVTEWWKGTEVPVRR